MRYTIGELIEELKRQPQGNLALIRFEPSGSVCSIVGCDSWRGVYSNLALEYDAAKEPNSVGWLVELLLRATGPWREFGGYKGGYYKMTNDTPIWVDNYGNYTPDREIVTVISEGTKTVLVVETTQKET